MPNIINSRLNKVLSKCFRLETKAIIPQIILNKGTRVLNHI